MDDIPQVLETIAAIIAIGGAVIAIVKYMQTGTLGTAVKHTVLMMLVFSIIFGGAAFFSKLNEQQGEYNQVKAEAPALNDPLINNTLNSWEQDSGCMFLGGTYHVTVDKGNYWWCLAQNTSFTNFLYEVDVSIIAGNYGGIVFRADEASGNFYYFLIGADGSCKLDIMKSGHPQPMNVKCSAGNTGLDRTNKVAVLASGEQLSIFINGQYVDEVDDGTYDYGAIGVIAHSANKSTEAIFNNARVWTV